MRRLPLLAVLLVGGACATSENPLDDYEELEATTIVPEDVAPGERTSQEYVHFGVYKSR